MEIMINWAKKALLSRSIMINWTEHTEYGPRSYALEKLNEVSEDLRELVLHVLNTMPVRQFLKITHFQASVLVQLNR